MIIEIACKMDPDGLRLYHYRVRGLEGNQMHYTDTAALCEAVQDLGIVSRSTPDSFEGLKSDLENCGYRIKPAAWTAWIYRWSICKEERE